MEEKVIFATGNADKMREIRMILADVEVAVLSLKEAGIALDVEENGNTYAENALIKARACAQQADCLILADDSGLEIDYLDREPGVYSARYMGEDTSYRIKNRNLIDRLEGVPDEKRTARFVCAIAAVLPDKSERLAQGVIEGRIGYEEKGMGGFGYDPIFYVPEYGCTTAEMDAEQKDAVSHRGKALEAMKQTLLAVGIWKKRK